MDERKDKNEMDVSQNYLVQPMSIGRSSLWISKSIHFECVIKPMAKTDDDFFFY